MVLFIMRWIPKSQFYSRLITALRIRGVRMGGKSFTAKKTKENEDKRYKQVEDGNRNSR